MESVRLFVGFARSLLFVIHKQSLCFSTHQKKNHKTCPRAIGKFIKADNSIFKNNLRVIELARLVESTFQPLSSSRTIEFGVLRIQIRIVLDGHLRLCSFLVDQQCTVLVDQMPLPLIIRRRL